MAKSSSPKKISDTRVKILNAARTLFVHHGYAGTSMGKIATEAGANHSLLFHHFGNKDNLWQEVKESILDKGKSISLILPAPDKPLEDYLEELVSRTILFYKNNPDIVRIINWQRLDAASSVPIGFTISKETETWLEICKIYQERGEINPSYKPEHIITLIFSVVGSIAMDQNVFIKSTDDNQDYIKFCIESLAKAIKQ